MRAAKFPQKEKSLHRAGISHPGIDSNKSGNNKANPSASSSQTKSRHTAGQSLLNRKNPINKRQPVTSNGPQQNKVQSQTHWGP